MPDRRKEVIDKVTALCRNSYGGNWAKMWRFYDANGDDRIAVTELKLLLIDAGIGNRLTREWWADGIVAALDRNGDGQIGFDEFQALFEVTV